MKTCPFCAEQIQDAAKKCRYCAEWLEPSDVHESSQRTPVDSPVPIRSQQTLLAQTLEAAAPARSESQVPRRLDWQELQDAGYSGDELAAAYCGDDYDLGVARTANRWTYVISNGDSDVRTFPYNDAGWVEAWRAYAAMEEEPAFPLADKGEPGDGQVFHEGAQYDLGIVRRTHGWRYVIWNAESEVESFPHDDGGWEQAWAHFSELEETGDLAPVAPRATPGGMAVGIHPAYSHLQNRLTFDELVDAGATGETMIGYFGDRYDLGVARTGSRWRYAIWDFGDEVESFDYSDEGWVQVWEMYADLEQSPEFALAEGDEPREGITSNPGPDFSRDPASSGATNGGLGNHPRPGQGTAVASLVLGLAGLLLPLVLSILAIVFGGIGISHANNRGAPGKGMAVAGLVLGIVGTLIWLSVASNMSQ